MFYMFVYFVCVEKKNQSDEHVLFYLLQLEVETASRDWSDTGRRVRWWRRALKSQIKILTPEESGLYTSMKSCSLEPVLVEAAVQMSELALVKQEQITSEELTPLDNFLNEKIQEYYSPEWDYASKSSPEQYTQIVRGQALEIALMRGCVTSPCDVAGGGHSILDAACRVFDSSQANESHYDTLECYSFLW